MGDKRETFYLGPWLTGYTDGDGTFSIYTDEVNKKITFTYKISQKNNNSQVLYFFKKLLGCGKVVHWEKTMSAYLVRDRKALRHIIIPFFQAHPLITSKKYDFFIFQEAFKIAESESLQQSEKIKLINNLKKNPEYKEIKSPAITKDWLVGFVEAEGSFYITAKDSNGLVHGFAITQKKDGHVLEAIIKELSIQAVVRFNKKGFFILDTTSGDNMKKIKLYFFNTMKSRKSLIYRIWARTFKYKGQYARLLKVQTILRNLK